MGRGDLRVLPPLVMNMIFVRTVLVLGILSFDFENLCLVEKFAMEAEGFLILLVHRFDLTGLWSHVVSCVLRGEFARLSLSRVLARS